MLKQLLLSLIVIPFVGMTVALAQPCTPGPENSPGIYPDSATGLPVGYANVLYSTVMTVVVPTDTVVSGFSIPIDSIGIVSLTGLPPGFTYTPNRPSGYWPGGQKGCVLISGTHGVLGTYPLVVEVQGYATGMSVPWTINYYKIVIDSTHLSIETINNNGFEVFQNVPNPFNGTTEISFNADVNDVFNFEVYNMIGKLVHNEAINCTKGRNAIIFNGQNLPQGVYFYKLNNGTRTITKRMILSSN